MTAGLALRAAQKAGARVFVRDGRLVVQSQGQLPHDVMAELQTHRDRLVEILLEPRPAPTAAAHGDPQSYMPWLDPKTAAERVWYPGVCRGCGRPMHDGDYVCPTPELRVAEVDDVREAIVS